MSDDEGHRPVPTPPKQPLTQPIQIAEERPPTKRRVSRRRRKNRLPDRAIVFVGPMAAGKTSLGRRVAKDLGIPFVDTDVVFTRSHGAIAEYFAQHGEAAFRTIEAEIIANELAEPGARVVALGGGAVITESTRQLLKEHPVVLLMTTQASVLRTANLDKRPLLRDDPEAWGRILDERRPFYAEVADVTFRTDRATKEQLSRRVVQWARAQGRGKYGASRDSRRQSLVTKPRREAPNSEATLRASEAQTPNTTQTKDEPRTP
ncbi:shikimate kinase [Leucobacter sp. W1153]|uniref:shikimate kinase n=1 Tax=Leucobacter sp. W1153 TaxID=3439064 RepID=UPI003F3B8FA4